MPVPVPTHPPIPQSTTVLVIGGGPAGSYAAAALAREGVAVTLLEADTFPRYHVGESMLASIRHLLRVIDLDKQFDSHGFVIKNGAAFKLNGTKREGYTDFIAAGGPTNYAWNVIRSESDNLMFQHAKSNGALCFDGVKVGDVSFAPYDPLSPPSSTKTGPELSDAVVSLAGDTKAEGEGKGGPDFTRLRPVAVTWKHKSSGSTGTLHFTYLIDASGRLGILSTRYLKTRRYNQGLRNVASWGYWRGAGRYAVGDERREGSPYFEALSDESGWMWGIPLHDGTMSVGVVQNQEMATVKKKALAEKEKEKEKEMGEGEKEMSMGERFYRSQMGLAPNLQKMLEKATLVSEIHNASDYSYSANPLVSPTIKDNLKEHGVETDNGDDWGGYAMPYARIIGDAGCFIDPYFSSGVHLALTGALSAAATISAALRSTHPELIPPVTVIPDTTTTSTTTPKMETTGVSEKTAGAWHSAKIGVGYTRFLLVVLSAYRQIRRQEKPVLSDFDEDNFDRAFAFFRPVIQGTADSHVSTLTQDELSKTLDFCTHAFEPTDPEERAKVLAKLEGGVASTAASTAVGGDGDEVNVNVKAITEQASSMEIKDKTYASKDLHTSFSPLSSTTTTTTQQQQQQQQQEKKKKTEKEEELAMKLTETLDGEEKRVLAHIRARRMMRTEDVLHMESFAGEGGEVFLGLVPCVERGRLGLVVSAN